MAKIEHVEHRLLNWARWKLTGGSGMLGYASLNLAEADGSRDGYREAVIPVSDCDASETDDAIQALPGHLRATVVEHYTSTRGHKDQARHLCCSAPTLYARIDDAHRRIAGYFTALHERRQAERQRVAPWVGSPVGRKKEFYE